MNRIIRKRFGVYNICRQVTLREYWQSHLKIGAWESDLEVIPSGMIASETKLGYIRFFAVPPKINQVHLLATTNNTLVFAWQRPPHNNGANISQYNFELLHDSQLHENRTMPANENSTRSNYMFVYVGLTPGDSYSFQVDCHSERLTTFELTFKV